MSKKKTGNGSRDPLPGEKLRGCLQECKTAEEVLAKIESLKARALEEAAKLNIADEGLRRAKQTLDSQLLTLVPMLREMQSILSQKSVLHYRFADLDLPSFTDWAKDFVSEAGIQASWSTIKRAMDPHHKSPSLRSEGHVPATKLQAQRVGYAALAGIELADALDWGQATEDAIGRVRASGATKADTLALLKRAGVKGEIEVTAAGSTAAQNSYPRFDSQICESPSDVTDVRPGGFSQVEELLDRVVGPASRIALNIDDSALQIAGFERLISYWARKWLPFNSNLGTMELSIRFVPKAKPELRREPTEATALEGRAMVPSDRLLSSSRGSAEVTL